MTCPRGTKLRCGYEEAEADAAADDPERPKGSVNAGEGAIVNWVRWVENGDDDDVVMVVTMMMMLMMMR